MSRFPVVGAWTFMLALVALSPAPVGAPQAAPDGFTTVGVDPAGDAANHLVPGVDVDAVVTSDRTDILALDLAVEDDTVLVRMTITTVPAGTGGYLYDVFFDVGGETYFTCFTTQWVGGQTSEENIKGCSRFTEGTQVGPATTADGVLVEGEGPGSVTWPVPLGDIGAAPGDAMAGVVAETWFRGVSTCCAGSTTDSQYMWNQADVAPDEDAWTATIGAGGAVPLPGLVLEDVAAPSFVTAGTTLTVNGTVRLDGDAANNTTYTIASHVRGVDWANGTEPETIELSTTLRDANVSLRFDVPGGAADTEADITWRLCHQDAPDAAAENGTANETNVVPCDEVTFRVSVFAPSPDDGNATAPDAQNRTLERADGDGNATAADEEASLPGPGVALTVALGALVLGRARRRPTAAVSVATSPRDG